MRVFRGLPDRLLRRPSAAAIGNFDGVHTGHKTLLRGVVEAARMRGLVPSVVTFEPHPREVVAASPLARISTLYDKTHEILSTGIERIYYLPFHKRFSQLSGEAFVKDVLFEGLDCRWITVGDDFRFGADRSGDVALLEEMGSQLGFELHVSPTLFHTDSRVSSSRIRKCLAQGDLFEASQMLGRRYSMTGRVIHGAALGRTIGFPTLNLSPIPAGSRAEPAMKGVYAVLVEGLDGAVHRGVASLGCKPTVASDKRWLLETHVFDWKGNAYGKVVRVSFVEKIRDEQKFPGIDALVAQIHKDAEEARRILGLAPSSMD